MRILIVIILLLCIIYLPYYSKFKHDYQILQVNLNTLKLDHLYEKYPIVIFDTIQNVEDLFKTVFAYSYVFKSPSTVPTGYIFRNTHKFMILNPDTDVNIKLINPKYKKYVKTNLEDSDDIQYVTIKLKEKQTLIIPALWYVYTDYMDIKSFVLDDLISKWIYKLV